MWDELAAADTVIAVTQGTVANADLSALVEPSLTAFADLDALIVVATGRDGVDLPALPANARVGGFLPFAELLSHADVFVTNGGFGATQHAIAAGVPVIVAGDSEDKPLVAARVARAGVGIDLGTGRPGPEQLRDAMGRLLGDPGYRHRVRALAEVYARHDAVGAIADLVTGEPDDPPGSSETGS